MVLTLRARGQLETTFVESAITSLFLPIQAEATRLFHGIRNLWYGYVYLVEVQEENLRLQAEISRLKEERNRLQEQLFRYKRLQKLFQFPQQNAFTVTPAEVVGLDASNWSEILYINKGTRQGVQKGMAVVTHEGIVGQIIQATPYFSKVMLITDARSAVDALVQRTRARGVVVGRGQRIVEMRYIPRGADIRRGDRIISSGMGGIFPKGIEVGVVQSIDEHASPIFHSVTILPSVDFSRLEEVLVITRAN